MSSLAFIVEGVKPSAKKNQLRPRHGGGFYTDSRVAPYEVALQAAAIEAMQAQGFEMLVDKPFRITFWIWVKSYGSIDLDNALTTALDAMQGICYNNDKFCVKHDDRKLLFRDGETWRTEIRIEALE